MHTCAYRRIIVHCLTDSSWCSTGTGTHCDSFGNNHARESQHMEQMCYMQCTSTPVHRTTNATMQLVAMRKFPVAGHFSASSEDSAMPLHHRLLQIGAVSSARCGARYPQQFPHPCGSPTATPSTDCHKCSRQPRATPIRPPMQVARSGCCT